MGVTFVVVELFKDAFLEGFPLLTKHFFSFLEKVIEKTLFPELLKDQTVELENFYLTLNNNMANKKIVEILK